MAIEGREPYGHALSKEKTVIGSGDDNDLVLKIKGISRKHAIIISEDEQFFIVDQGSAGGTYINEEQLVPGQRTEFTSFFPIKLGPYVTLSLLSEEEESKTFEFAKTLPAEPVVAAPAKVKGPAVAAKKSPALAAPARKGLEGREGIHTRKSSRVKGAAKPVSADGQRMLRTKLAAALLLMGTGWWFYTEQRRPELDVPAVTTTAPQSSGALTQEAGVKLAELELALRSPTLTAQEILADNGCDTSLEQVLCQTNFLPDPSAPQGGIRITPTYIVVVLPRRTKEEAWEKYKSLYSFSDTTKPMWTGALDERDAIAMAFLALEGSNWDFVTETHQWVFGMVLNSDNSTDQIYFADAKRFKATLLEFKLSSMNQVKLGNPDFFMPLAGGLRVLD